jgi:DNA-binding protein, ybaB/ebfC family
MKARLPEGFNMKQSDMVKRMQKIQEDMAAAQSEIEQSSFEASSGGGAVKVEMNGKKELLTVKIDKEVVDPDDVEMLEDLIVAAVNEVIKTVDDKMESAMSSITGGLNIPGL